MLSNAVSPRRGPSCTVSNPFPDLLIRSGICRGLPWSVRTPRYRGTSLCKARQWRFQVRPEPVGTVPMSYSCLDTLAIGLIFKIQ